LLKNRKKTGKIYQPLLGKSLVMIFEKQSTRTRLSFEIGIGQLGGSAVVIQTRDTQLGRGEPIEDASKVISRMCDMVMIRTFHQEQLKKFANNSLVPVINGLTNEHHPCQILADIFTFIEERGQIQDKLVTWIGDINNVCLSWIEAASILGFKLNISCPPEYKDSFYKIKKLDSFCKFYNDPIEACSNADLITTDVWTSMGFENELDERRKIFKEWTVDEEKMNHAADNALFMHCLPAHRGEEVSSAVIDGPNSVVWNEAENRLHVQKALMEFLLLRYEVS
jgi:ornithine carbamoyltransferase